MSNLEQLPPGEEAAYRQGWRAGLTLGALALAVVSFINIPLGIEKSILAIVLAVIALRGAGPGRARSRGRAAVAIGVLHVALVMVVVVVFHEKLMRLLSLLQHLG